MVKKALNLFMAVLLSGTLVSCGSSEDQEDSGQSSSGGYINCVLEYTRLKKEGIISATPQEITQECMSQSLP
jgi:hypothetical protein